MEEGVIVPIAYFLSRDAGPGLVQTAQAAFAITPLSCVIIHDMKDHNFAAQFDSLIVRTDDETGSIEFAVFSFNQIKIPSLIIGKRVSASVLALHEDGHWEELPWRDQDLIIN